MPFLLVFSLTYLRIISNSKRKPRANICFASFDAAGYLEANADVAAAVTAGMFLPHWITLLLLVKMKVELGQVLRRLVLGHRLQPQLWKLDLTRLSTAENDGIFGATAAIQHAERRR